MKGHPRAGLVLLCTALMIAFGVALPVASAQSGDDTFVVGIAEWYVPEGVEFWSRVIVPKFNELHPDLKVEIRRIGWGAEQLQVQYAAGVAPDVIQYGSDKFGSYFPILAPLNELMERKPLEDMDDFPQAGFEASAKDGLYYGVPWYIDIRTLVYNKEYFRQAGLDDTRGPATWDEVRDFAQKLTRRDAGGQILVEGVKIDPHWLIYSPWVFQGGGRYVTDDMKSALNSEGTRRAVEFTRALVNEYEVSVPPSMGFAVDTGQSAMGIESIGILADAGQVELSDIGVDFPPMGVQRTTLISPNQWGIIRNSRHKEAAWDWIWLASTYDHLAEMARLNQISPPRASMIGESPWADDPRTQTFLQIAGMGTTFNGGTPGFEQIVRNVVGPTIQAILYEGESLALLADASDRIDAIIAEESAKLEQMLE